jgi:hypothetical protein
MCAAVLAALTLAACSSKETPAPPAAQAPTAPPAAPAAADATAQPAPAPAAAPAQASWTPEALEDLLAPVALYPDPVLSQVLIASTNPQEVLDAGNWLIANETLSGKALDEAAAQAGFTPPARALLQFPQVVDTMCMEMGWTTELGEAFVADQAGVLAAVQRLRMQAKDVGNLQSSPQMTVETQVQEGQEVVVLKPPKPEVVYVPQYDPVAAYAPAPAAATAPSTVAPVETQKSGYSTGQMITTGVLSFGAGILVNELFDDDDNNRNKYDYYYPNYGYGGMPYYPPYPYRPSYGGGYYPSQGYNRPPNWNGGYQNNGNIVINTGGNDYWNRYPKQGGNQARPRPVSSPISAARPNRPDLAKLNQRPARPMPADYKRPSREATAANWKGQSGYAGRDKRPAASRDPQDRIANAQPGYSRPATKPSTRDAQRPAPKVQGSYAGRDREARPAPTTRDVQRPQTKDVSRPMPNTRDVKRPNTRDVQKPVSTRDVKRPPVQGDRGYSKDKAPRPVTRDVQPKPQTRDVQRPAPQPRPTAVGGAQKSGKADKAASQRGKQSLPKGARSKGAGQNKKKQAR